MLLILFFLLGCYRVDFFLFPRGLGGGERDAPGQLSTINITPESQSWHGSRGFRVRPGGGGEMLTWPRPRPDAQVTAGPPAASPRGSGRGLHLGPPLCRLLFFGSGPRPRRYRRDVAPCFAREGRVGDPDPSWTRGFLIGPNFFYLNGPNPAHQAKKKIIIAYRKLNKSIYSLEIAKKRPQKKLASCCVFNSMEVGIDTMIIYVNISLRNNLSMLL